MAHITTCTQCGKAYEELSEEYANDPKRRCNTCALMLAAQPLINLAKRVYGDTEYTYYCIPISYSGRGQNARHYSPATGLERYEITREDYEKHVEQSRRDDLDAFTGRLKGSYQKYARRICRDGWRENLIALLKEEIL